MVTAIAERKSITVEVKADDAEGSFVARIATLGAIDKDDDIILPGAAPAGKLVIVSPFEHSSFLRADLPVGKAVLSERGSDLIATGNLFMANANAQELYTVLKEAGDIVEWSFGYRVTEWAMEERDGKTVRIIKKMDAWEVSPVVVGAGVNTGTLNLKTAAYADQGDALVEQLGHYVERTKSLAGLRAQSGRGLNAANRERLSRLLAGIKTAADGIDALLGKADDGDDDASQADADEAAAEAGASAAAEAHAAYAQFLHEQAQLEGVVG